MHDCICQSNHVKLNASVNIISPNDTVTTVSYSYPTEIKIGMTMRETIDIIGYANKCIIISKTKQKWIYDTQYVYFTNGLITSIIINNDDIKIINDTITIL